MDKQSGVLITHQNLAIRNRSRKQETLERGKRGPRLQRQLIVSGVTGKRGKKRKKKRGKKKKKKTTTTERKKKTIKRRFFYNWQPFLLAFVSWHGRCTDLFFQRRRTLSRKICSFPEWRRFINNIHHLENIWRPLIFHANQPQPTSKGIADMEQTIRTNDFVENRDRLTLWWS